MKRIVYDTGNLRASESFGVLVFHPSKILAEKGPPTKIWKKILYFKWCLGNFNDLSSRFPPPKKN